MMFFAVNVQFAMKKGMYYPLKMRFEDEDREVWRKYVLSIGVLNF